MYRVHTCPGNPGKPGKVLEFCLVVEKILEFSKIKICPGKVLKNLQRIYKLIYKRGLGWLLARSVEVGLNKSMISEQQQCYLSFRFYH